MTVVFLVLGADGLERARRYRSKAVALDVFRETATELARHEQTITGWLHCASNRAELVEDADYMLSLGPRGGVKVERT